MPALGASTPDQWATYFTGVAAASQSAPDQLAIAHAALMNPLEAAASKAGTAKTELETKQLPADLAVRQQEANTGSYNAATQRTSALKPTIENAPGTNTPYATRFDMGGNVTRSPLLAAGDGSSFNPTPGGGGFVGGPGRGAAPAAAGMAPPQGAGMPGGLQVPPADPAAPQGTPATFGQTPGQQKLIEAIAPKVADMVDTVPTIVSAMARFNSLKGQIENERLLTGPLFGSEGVKELLGTMSQLPGMPPKMREYVANTQVFDATALSGVFNLMGEGKGTLPRSTAALDMLVKAKPGTVQYREAMLSLTNSLLSDLSERLAYIDNLSGQIKKGNVPTSADIPTSAPRATARQQLDKTPASAQANPGRMISGPDGTFKSNGSNWELVGPPTR
jgi:hypothetical protein